LAAGGCLRAVLPNRSLAIELSWIDDSPSV
jgi:hypothetical protein